MVMHTLALANATTTLEDHRLLAGAAYVAAGTLARESGFLPAPLDEVATLTTVSAMVAAIGPFTAIIQGTTSAAQGAYLVASDAPVNLTFDPGEPSVDRDDQVIVHIRDDTYDGSGVRTATVEILKGQASGAATALPDSCLLSWIVTVPAGASAGTGGINFLTASTDIRPFTVAAGGMAPFNTSAPADWFTNPSPYQLAWSTSERRAHVFHDDSWNPFPAPRVYDIAGAATEYPSSQTGNIAGFQDPPAIGIRDTSVWREFQAHPTTTSTTPFIGASTTAPTRGTSSWNYEYTVFGSLVAVSWKVGIASGWASGSGIYRFPLPYMPELTGCGIGSAWIYDGGTNMSAAVVVETDATAYATIRDQAFGVLSHVGPAGAGWASGDFISGSVLYRKAD